MLFLVWLNRTFHGLRALNGSFPFACSPMKENDQSEPPIPSPLTNPKLLTFASLSLLLPIILNLTTFAFLKLTGNFTMILTCFHGPIIIGELRLAILRPLFCAVTTRLPNSVKLTTEFMVSFFKMLTPNFFAGPLSLNSSFYKASLHELLSPLRLMPLGITCMLLLLRLLVMPFPPFLPFYPF